MNIGDKNNHHRGTICPECGADMGECLITSDEHTAYAECATCGCEHHPQDLSYDRTEVQTATWTLIEGGLAALAEARTALRVATRAATRLRGEVELLASQVIIQQQPSPGVDEVRCLRLQLAESHRLVAELLNARRVGGPVAVRVSKEEVSRG
jgi:hypothetical protein